MTEVNRKNLFKIIEPLASIFLAVLGVLSTGAPDWIRYGAISIAIILAIAWLFSESGWVGKAIKFRWFRSRLSKDQAVRLSVLLDDISNQMSYSYTLSPFYVWRNCSNSHSGLIKFNESYFSCLGGWMHDLKEKFENPGVDNFQLLNSLSKAVSETTRLAEYAERELEGLLKNKELTEQERARILKEWDSAKNNFNHWIDKWRTLFKEVNKTTNLNCIEYYRPLEMIG